MFNQIGFGRLPYKEKGKNVLARKELLGMCRRAWKEQRTDGSFEHLEGKQGEVNSSKMVSEVKMDKNVPVKIMRE